MSDRRPIWRDNCGCREGRELERPRNWELAKGSLRVTRMITGGGGGKPGRLRRRGRVDGLESGVDEWK